MTQRHGYFTGVGYTFDAQSESSPERLAFLALLSRHRPPDVCGPFQLLELGCGLALPAVVGSRRGFRAVASDYEEDALEGVRYNADRNGAETLETMLLDWRRLPDDLGVFDLVVAADVLYEKHHAQALAAVVARTLGPCGVALVADPGRARDVAAFTPWRT